MAPARKSRSVNKRFSYEASPEKDIGNLNKKKQRRKLSDKLGPQWSKGELRRFYEAYRKYGKDWKKVAVAVRNRSVEMVEALYSMNRAYLSLPEGTASVVGLIAMMTDHYNVMEESDSEQESDDPSEILQKPQKRKQAKIHGGSPKEDSLRFQSNGSSDGCLFYLKGGHSSGSQPRAVGKRTPRVPVYRETFVTPNKKARTSEVDARVDEGAHVAALALTEALQRGGSPQVSSSPYGRTEYRKSPPVRSWGKMFPQSEMAQGKLRDASIYGGSLEGRVGGRKLENGAHARDRKSLEEMEGVGTVEVHRKGKKIYGKRMQVEEIGNNHSDDDAEACSGTEGLKGSALKGFDVEVSNSKTAQFCPRAQRKRNKKLFFGDELDALQALAELSTMESESSVQLKEDQNTDDKCSVPEATSTIHHRDKAKHTGSKGKLLHSITGAEGTTSKKSKIAPCSPIDGQAVTELKQEPQVTIGTMKRKRKSSISTVSNAEAHVDLHSSKQVKSEASAEEENKSPGKSKRTSHVSAQSKQWKSGLGDSSIADDQKRAGIGLPISTAQVSPRSLVNVPAKRPSRRKMDLKRKLSRGVRASENLMNNALNKYSVPAQDGLLCIKDKLSSCLSAFTVCRWCMFEWFYSAIDYPWFAKREFVEYLNHVGLGHIPRLTRVEWGVIRSSLGKPRRFSEHFLHEERFKLQKYRETVRKTYTDLRTGVREGVPTDLARPLSVGQRVIAIHPKTREIHDGSVLTVDHDKCRVQFDRPEIGVEFVMDIDCMPLNPLDNMPEALRRQNISLHNFSEIPGDPQVNAHLNLGGSMIFAASGHSEIAPSPINALIKQDDTNHAISRSKAAAIDRVSSQQACYGQLLSGAHLLAREADIRAISDVNRSNVKRDALVMELRNANNALLEDQYNGDGSLKDFEPFKKHYATVLVQLKEASDQASSALLQLRQRNTYPGNSVRPWMKPPATTSLSGVLTSSVDNSLGSHESVSGSGEIVKGSRLKARTMVDAAIQAMSSVKEGEDAFVRIGEALDSLDKWQFISDTKLPATKSQEEANGGLGHNNHLLSGISEPMHTNSGSGQEQYNNSVKNDAQIPSELITSCVATLLMIQKCTERQYPPADVAQIIDCAVTSLHPHCPQNLPLFREIQMCMGRIKTQILALIPT